MKIKEGFILREVAGDIVALPIDGDFNAMITLNGTGAFLWKKLESETTKEALVEALLAEYDVDADTAKSAVEHFLSELNKNEFII